MKFMTLFEQKDKFKTVLALAKGGSDYWGILDFVLSFCKYNWWTRASFGGLFITNIAV
jgi:hypothetical protein